jgi:hypothetical protein
MRSSDPRPDLPFAPARSSVEREQASPLCCRPSSGSSNRRAVRSSSTDEIRLPSDWTHSESESPLSLKTRFSTPERCDRTSTRRKNTTMRASTTPSNEPVSSGQRTGRWTNRGSTSSSSTPRSTTKAQTFRQAKGNLLRSLGRSSNLPGSPVWTRRRARSIPLPMPRSRGRSWPSLASRPCSVSVSTQSSIPLSFFSSKSPRY